MAADPVRGLLGLGASEVRWLKYAAITMAVLALAIGYLGRQFGWLSYRPGGAAFDNYVQPGFAIIFVVALLIALRWELAGGVLASFAGAGMVAFALNQLQWGSASLVVASMAVPGVLWILVDLNGFTTRQAYLAVAGTLVAAVAGYVVGNGVYQHYWGPTHPESVVEALPDSPVAWLWTGAVTTETAQVRAEPSSDQVTSARLRLSVADEPGTERWFSPRDEQERILTFELADLMADTDYIYAIEVNGELDATRTGRFSTFPSGPASFTVAVGACARVGSNGRVFDTIRELNPLLYIITGDLHYGDLAADDIERYRQVMDYTLTRPAQSALYRSLPIAYVWDDHDFGPNDADGRSPSRQAAMAGYREYVPSYELAGPSSAVYQAFTVGRVRFILTDARSARNLESDDPDAPPSMLGLAQREWLEQELLQSSPDHALVVWVNPVPWVADADPTADNWGGYAEERRELANLIADNGVDNLVMVSGDAHMLAIDDGSHTNFSDTPGPAFPLLHAAPLDRPGSTKGGPYTEGPVDNSGQFGTITIDDRGDEIEATLTGLDWQGNEVMSYSFVTEVRPGLD